MRDGKLITLHNHVAVPRGQQARFPLNRLPFYFPIPPIGSLNRRASASHSSNRIVRRGEVSQFGGPDLKEISWSSEFLVPEWYENPAYIPEQQTVGPNGIVTTSHADPRPGTDPGIYRDQFRYFPSYFLKPPPGFQHYGALQAAALIENIMDDGLVVVLMIQDRNTGRIETRMPVTIRSFDMKEEGGEPDTRFYDISFKQYRFLTIRSVPRGGKVPSGGKPRPSMVRYVPTPYTTKVAMGIQTLSQIAYRRKDMWKHIVAANGGSKGMFKKGAEWHPRDKNGPYHLPKGTKLGIPRVRIVRGMHGEVDKPDANANPGAHADNALT